MKKWIETLWLYFVSRYVGNFKNLQNIWCDIKWQANSIHRRSASDKFMQHISIDCDLHIRHPASRLYYSSESTFGVAHALWPWPDRKDVRLMMWNLSPNKMLGDRWAEQSVFIDGIDDAAVRCRLCVADARHPSLNTHTRTQSDTSGGIISACLALLIPPHQLTTHTYASVAGMWIPTPVYAHRVRRTEQI